jgi:hypothetical protein
MGNARPGEAGPGPGRPAGGEGVGVEDLLARAQNAFEVGDEVLERLTTALMAHTELASFRQRKGPPRKLSRRTLRHNYLLADGGSVTLWEIEHNTGPGGGRRYEVYADPESLAAAQYLVDARFGDPSPEELEAEAADWLARLPELASLELPQCPRQYTEDQSAEHAWRVLRRAENEDAPGEKMRRLLLSAIGHDITYVTGRHLRADRRVVGWTLYEHAFLLATGEEVSLWEVEHTMNPEGRPVCEVYDDERAACDAADLRLEAL